MLLRKNSATLAIVNLHFILITNFVYYISIIEFNLQYFYSLHLYLNSLYFFMNNVSSLIIGKGGRPRHSYLLIFTRLIISIALDNNFNALFKPKIHLH